MRNCFPNIIPITIKGIKKPFTAKKGAKKVKMCYYSIAKVFWAWMRNEQGLRVQMRFDKSIEGVCVFFIRMAGQYDSNDTKMLTQQCWEGTHCSKE